MRERRYYQASIPFFNQNGQGRPTTRRRRLEALSNYIDFEEFREELERILPAPKTGRRAAL